MPKKIALVILTLLLVACGKERVVESIFEPTSTSSSARIVATDVSDGSSFVQTVLAEKSDGIPPSSLSVPILVYHHIRDTSPWDPSTWSWKMSVSPDIFEQQMDWIVDHNYTTITLDEYVAIREGRMTAPEKAVVITFDDNQLSTYDIGVPIMAARKIRAVFYLVANRIENSAFIGNAQIPDLLAKGMDIQSHTFSHPNLTNLSDEELDAQLVDSKRILEAATGRPVRHIAYPLTAHNTKVREHTEAAGYTTGTIMDPRNATLDSGMYKLPRIMMTDTTDLSAVLP